MRDEALAAEARVRALRVTRYAAFTGACFSARVR